MLVELLIAGAIIGIITGAISTSVFQTFNGSAQGASHMTAVKQVESAIHWLSRDIQMAQTVQPGGSDGFPLVLSWTEWDNTVNQVTYSLAGDQFQRSHSIDGGEAVVTTVARHIDTDTAMTNCQFTDGVLSFKLTAALGIGAQASSETRVGEIIPRPSS